MMITLNRTTGDSMIGPLVSNMVLKDKRSVSVLFTETVDTIDTLMKSIYEKTIFGVHLVNRLDGKYNTGLLNTDLEWFLIISDKAEDGAWWKRALADIYNHGPYRPTVVLWFDKTLTMADRYQILQVTLGDYWFHKAVIAYPSVCGSVGNCVVLTTAKDSGLEMDVHPSMLSLLADESNITAAVDEIKSIQLEFETNFEGRKVKVTAAVKASFVEEIKLSDNHTQMVGIDVVAFHEICSQLNLTPVIEIIGRGSEYIDNLNSTLASLDGRKEFVSLNRYFSSPLTAEHLIPVGIESFHFVLQNRRTRNHGWKIFTGFQPTVWAGVCSTLFVVAILWRCLLGGSVLSLVQATVSTSHVTLQLTSHRLVWISWLLFVLLIVNSLNGTIVTQLAKPVYSQKINTLKDLLKSDMRLFTEVRGLPNERHDPVVTALMTKTADVYAERPTADMISRAAFLTSDTIRMVLRKIREVNGIEYYVIPEALDRTFSGYLMSPRNPAFDTFKNTILMLLESGHYVKWTSEYVNNVTFDSRYNYYFQLYNSSGGGNRTPHLYFYDLELAFGLYMAGVLLAFLAFLAEIFVYKFQKLNRYSLK